MHNEKLDKIDEKLYEIIKMKIIVLIVLFASVISNSQEYTILNINSSWNSKNDYKDLYKIKDAKIVKLTIRGSKCFNKKSNKISTSIYLSTKTIV